MGDLAHQRAVVRMDAVAELLEVGDDSVVADVELPEHRGRIGRDVGRPTEHREGQPAPCLLLVVPLVALGRHAADVVRHGVARAHDAVLQREVLERKRAQQRIGHVGLLSDLNKRSYRSELYAEA